MRVSIRDYPDYSITKSGKVWSRISKRFLRSAINSRGYLQVWLCHNKKRKSRHVHRLVLETYAGPCPKGMVCRHLNGDQRDNRFTNLCWGTVRENTLDAFKHGTRTNVGEANSYSKVTERDVRLIFNAYHDGANTQQELADYFNITISNVSCIVNKKSWKHIWRN